MPASATLRRTSPLPAIPTWCRPATRAAWSHGAFSGEVKDGFLYGRGAVDMKGGIACSVAAVLEYLADNGGKPKGSISFLITGDEEDISVNGTIKLLQWAAARGEKFDHCVLGEPSNVETLGDCIKVGRRGSQSGTLYVDGVQGHVAYPHRAANPVPDISTIDRGAQRRAARSRQRAVPGLEPRIHLGRCRQHRQQRDPRRRRARNSTSASTTTTPRRRCGRWSSSAW